MKKTIIEIPIWDIDIVLMVGGNVKDILKEATKRKLSKSVIDEIIKDNIESDDRGACYFCPEQIMSLMWYPNYTPSYSTLGHESLHLVDFISTYIGAEMEMEFRAYTWEYLIKTIRLTLKKMKDENSKT